MIAGMQEKANVGGAETRQAFCVVGHTVPAAPESLSALLLRQEHGLPGPASLLCLSALVRALHSANPAFCSHDAAGREQIYALLDGLKHSDQT